MYTLYNASGEMLRNGVYHIRANGEIVRKLKEEDADYSNQVARVRRKDNDGYYFFIIEYEQGDSIKLENFLSKEWYMELQLGINDIGVIAMVIKNMFPRFLRENKPVPQKVYNLLREVMPKLFKEAYYASSQENRTLFFTHFSQEISYLGKTLNDYVEQSDIDKYASYMIKCYDLCVVEMLLKEKGVKISEQNVLAYKVAKERLAETIEIVKEKIKTRSFTDIGFRERAIFPFITIYIENTPCGNVTVFITPIGNSGYFHFIDISLHVENESLPMSTKIEILTECEEFRKELEKEIYGGEYIE